MRYIFLVLVLIDIAFAHKLNLFLYEENNKVYASSYFSSGSVCKNCDIKVFNGNNKLIEEGKTNRKGEYIIHEPTQNIIVKVETIGGHAAKEQIKLKNLKSKKEVVHVNNSIFSSIIAAIAVLLIFMFLKRVVK